MTDNEALTEIRDSLSGILSKLDKSEEKADDKGMYNEEKMPKEEKEEDEGHEGQGDWKVHSGRP